MTGRDYFPPLPSVAWSGSFSCGCLEGLFDYHDIVLNAADSYEAQGRVLNRRKSSDESGSALGTALKLGSLVPHPPG